MVIVYVFQTNNYFHFCSQRFSGLVARRGRPFGRRLVVERQRDRLSRALLSRVPAIPASDVPEELVEEAMAVLQGKSREVVIRELQRTVSCFVSFHSLLFHSDTNQFIPPPIHGHGVHVHVYPSTCITCTYSQWFIGPSIHPSIHPSLIHTQTHNSFLHAVHVYTCIILYIYL